MTMPSIAPYVGLLIVPSRATSSASRGVGIRSSVTSNVLQYILTHVNAPQHQQQHSSTAQRLAPRPHYYQVAKFVNLRESHNLYSISIPFHKKHPAREHPCKSFTLLPTNSAERLDLRTIAKHRTRCRNRMVIELVGHVVLKVSRLYCYHPRVMGWEARHL